ncbi:MAG: DUF177 domain-containing protein [bacterium]|nr:DUF177 domain-containing protein [Candidatus Sumerlaeota bacterium]
MKIEVRNLLQGPVELSVDCAPKELEFEADNYIFTGRVSGNAAFQLIEHRVLARGTLRANAETECVRCLRRMSIPLTAHVDVLYEHNPELLKNKIDGGDVDDEHVAWFDGETIHPAQEFREALLIELPGLPVCSEQCKGLCQQCGADLNRGPCACALEKTAPPASGETEWKNAIRKIRPE